MHKLKITDQGMLVQYSQTLWNPYWCQTGSVRVKKYFYPVYSTGETFVVTLRILIRDCGNPKQKTIQNG